jgi:hypothetical protein
MDNLSPCQQDQVRLSLTYRALQLLSLTWEMTLAAKGHVRPGRNRHFMIQKAVSPTAKVISAERLAGIKITYLKMGYEADLSDLGPIEKSFGWISDSEKFRKSIENAYLNK